MGRYTKIDVFDTRHAETLEGMSIKIGRMVIVDCFGASAADHLFDPKCLRSIVDGYELARLEVSKRPMIRRMNVGYDEVAVIGDLVSDADQCPFNIGNAKKEGARDDCFESHLDSQVRRILHE